MSGGKFKILCVSCSNLNLDFGGNSKSVEWNWNWKLKSSTLTEFSSSEEFLNNVKIFKYPRNPEMSKESLNVQGFPNASRFRNTDTFDTNKW